MKIVNRLKLILTNVYMAVLSLFWKKDDTIIVVGAWMGERFADNPRFLFQYLSENKEKLGLSHVIWVTHSEKIIDMIRGMGYEAEKLGTKESIQYHKLAGYHICNNTPSGSKGNKNELDAKYSFRAKRINLWHGIGIKGGVFCSNEYLKKKKQHPFRCMINEKLLNIKVYRAFMTELGGWGDCYWLTTTPAFTHYLHSWMLGPYNHYLELDYPRNQECLKYTEEEKRIISIIRQHNKSAIYLPTYRADKTKFDINSLYNAISDGLLTHDILWIQKAHSIDKGEETNLYENILTLESGFDVNVLYPFVSVVITDYSSVSPDAVYHNIPVIYYVPDWNDYAISDRGFIEKPDDFMAGPVVTKPEEVLQNIITLPELDEHYYHIKERYWKPHMTYLDIWNGIKDLT